MFENYSGFQSSKSFFLQHQLMTNSFSLILDSNDDPLEANYESAQPLPYCWKCGKVYTWPESLKRHLRESCGVLPKHTCEICKKRFRRREHLLRHVSTVHKQFFTNDDYY